MPLEKACANTTTSGSTTKTVRKVTASAMMMKRPGAGSVRRSARNDSARTVVRLAGSWMELNGPPQDVASKGARGARGPKGGKFDCVEHHRPLVRGGCGLRQALKAD